MKQSPQTDLEKILQQLKAQQTELTRLGQLETEVVALRQQLKQLPAAPRDTYRNGSGHSPLGNTISEAESLELTDRRSMLKKVGALAAGVAAVGLLRPTSSKAAASGGGKEGATPNASGDPFILGTSNVPTGTDVTSIIAPGTVVIPALFRADNYSQGSMGAPPAGNTTAGLFHTNNQGGTPTSGTLHAIYAVAESPAGGVGVGVHAEGDFRGVRAVGGVSGEGVNAICHGATNSFAVQGTSDLGYGAVFTGGNVGVYASSSRTALALEPSGANPNTSAQSFDLGDVVSPGNGDLWHCVTGGVGNGAARFRKFSGLATAGAAHILASPVRFVDTFNNVGGSASPFAAGEVRPYDFDALQAGTIPVRATGIFGNITVRNPVGNGNVQTNSVNSFPAAAAAVMSFRTGVNLSNHFVSGLNASGQMFVKVNVSSSHLIIDIQGYYI